MSEQNRLAALHRYQILGTATDRVFDDIVHLAAHIAGVQHSSITFIDEECAWAKAATAPEAQGSKTPKPDSFCNVAIEQQSMLVLSDAQTHPTLSKSRARINGKPVRYYVGVPLIDPSGYAVGVLCVFDTDVREASPDVLLALSRLAHVVIQLLESRVKASEDRAESHILALLNSVTTAANSRLSVRECIETCLKEVCAYAAAPLGHYFDRDPRDADSLISSGLWFTKEPDKFGRFRELTETIEFKKGVGIAGRAFELREPTSNAAPNRVYERSIEGQREGLNWAFAFPVILQNEVVGVFEFFLPDRIEDDANLLKVMVHVADQIARVIERARVDEAQEKQKEFLNAVLENLSDGVVACNADGQLLLFNRALREFHGLPADAGLDPAQWASHYKLFHADGISRMDLADVPLQRAFMGERVHDSEMMIEHTSGRKLSLTANGHAIVGKDGKRLGALVAMRDITQFKKDQTQLIETNRALRAATMAKSQFLANMSHEIRTPLNGVIGMTEILRESALTDEQREHVEIIMSSAQNLLTIISDILDFSKVEAGKLEIETVPFDLSQVVKDVHRKLEHAAVSKGLRFTTEIVGELGSLVKGDAGRLRQILMNLINNAIKFTSVGSVQTSLRYHDLGDQVGVRIDVVDTGIGISKLAAHHLFRAFSQADSSTTRKFGGTGLGLSISKRLIELMGGEIGVESEEGKGSTFWLTLRFDKAASTKAIEGDHCSITDDSIDVVAKVKGLRVLLAEDNQINQMIAKKILVQMGLEVEAVENGQQAVEALEAKAYDLVLMDCQMPQLDGYEATRQIRSHDSPVIRETKVVAMTANAMKGDREKCLHAGMDDYLTKPVKVEELKAVLIRHLISKAA